MDQTEICRRTGFFYRVLGGVFSSLLLLSVASCSDLIDNLESSSVSTHSISYNLNEGKWVSGYTAPVKYQADKTVTLPSAADIGRDKYTFAGWYDNQALTGSAVSGWQAGEKNADVVLWAKWISSGTVISRFVFTAADNSGLASDVYGTIDTTARSVMLSVPHGTDVSALKAVFAVDGLAADAVVSVNDVVQKSGETANNFSAPVVYTIGGADGSSVQYTVTVKVRALNEYSIVYNLNGGTWIAGVTRQETYMSDQKVTLPTAADIRCAGYMFNGWHDNEALGGNIVSGWDAEEKNADMVLWAKWVPSGTIITRFMFPAAQNSGLAADVVGELDTVTQRIAVSVPHGTDVSALKAEFTVYGTASSDMVASASVLVNGVVQKSGETANDFRSPVVYTLRSADGNFQEYTVTVTVRAPNTYGIIYNLKGGSWFAGAARPETYTADQKVTLPTAADIWRTGYRFDGWYDNDALSGTAVSGWEAGEKKSDMMLWAKWNAEKYTITLNSQGATSVKTTEVTATFDQKLPSITPPTKDDCVFGGYWTEENGKGKQYYPTTGNGAVFWDKAAGTTLYAKWIPGTPVSVNAVTAAIENIKGTGTVTVDGVLTAADIESISNALQIAGDSGKRIVLNMSACTGLDTLPLRAFSGCNSLVSVTLPSCVTAIKSYVFMNCNNLTEILIDADNAAYTERDGVLFSKDGKKLICFPAGRTGEYTVPDGVTDIADSAFWGCRQLSKVTLPAGMKHIGNCAFENCASLTEMTLPDGVETIGGFAFYGCTLRSVSIPDSLTSIGESAFSKTLITDVTIPAKVEFIGIAAFEGCSKLKTLTINNTSGWFRSNSSTDLVFKKGGVAVDESSLTNPLVNNDYFISLYAGYYWYKK